MRPEFGVTVNIFRFGVHGVSIRLCFVDTYVSQKMGVFGKIPSVYVLLYVKNTGVKIMIAAQVFKSGNSLALRLPKILDFANEGMYVEMVVIGGE